MVNGGANCEQSL